MRSRKKCIFQSELILRSFLKHMICTTLPCPAHSTPLHSTPPLLSVNLALGLIVNLPLKPSMNWALVLGYISRDFLNGRKMSFMNETKGVNDLLILDRLSFLSENSDPIVVCAHASLAAAACQC